MNTEKITKDLVEYLKSTISPDLLPSDLSPSFQLLESGAMDSLELFKLIAHLEDAFNVQIKPEEIVPENFSTIQAIVEVVQKHLP